MKIIFLDFDGVMDTGYYDMMLLRQGLPECDEYGVVFDPQCVANLCTIIKNTKADIVVTSSWKYLMSYKQLLEMWSARGLPGFITDMTPNVSNHRGNEIDAWLKECECGCEYVIIDDLCAANFNIHQLPFLITVNPYNGLDEIATEKAISILNRQPTIVDF